MYYLKVKKYDFYHQIEKLSLSVLYEDDRQKKGKHLNIDENCRKYCISKERVRLKNSDYLLDSNDQNALAWVDTKRDWSEIGGNVCGSKDKKKNFEQELKRASDDEKTLFIVVESVLPLEEWVNPNRKGIYGWRDVQKRINVLEKKYSDVRFIQCSPDAVFFVVLGILTGAFSDDAVLERMDADEQFCVSKIAETLKNYGKIN